MRTINLLFLVLCFAVVTLVAQDQPNQDESQKAWMEYMAPGWAHEHLAKGVGEWTYEQKFWSAPETDPQITSGTAVGEMIMGGRYLKSKHTGTAWGMPFEGMSIEGYDNATQEFMMIWIDNLGTGFANAKGSFDKENNQIIYMGTMIDPIKKKEIDFKQVAKVVDNNTSMFEMFMNDPSGNEFKVMEAVMKKKP
ncbi:MAG: DUF1579 domain-containing protein [Bacteroidetes bacterium]|nr:DUF1579 domain-containing protein [Bacteroidota bacterium]